MYRVSGEGNQELVKTVRHRHHPCRRIAASFAMGSQGVWPRNAPALASYDDKDVVVYLTDFQLGLMAIAKLVDHASNDTSIILNEPPASKRTWIAFLPAQLQSTGAWERASVAYVQLLETFELFARPFETFLLRAAELDIPDIDVRSERWILKCVTLCLAASRVDTVKSSGFRSVQDFNSCAHNALIANELLLKFYKGRLAAGIGR
jgi:hypothetical protein